MNVNYLSNIEFRFTINRLPNVEFYIQGVTMPGISSGATIQPSPFKNINRPGDKLEYEDLTLKCIIDEKMEAYFEVWNWLIGITKPLEFGQYKRTKESEEGIFSDATLTILNSNKNPHVEVNFRNLFPTSVSSIDFDTKQTDVEPPMVDFTFKYGYYDFKTLP